MKTNQIMKREFMGGAVEQEHKTGYFCINDLTIIANKYRKNQGLPEARWDKYKDSKKTKEFFHSLMKEEQVADIIRTTRGRNGKTWVHPLVLIDYMMWLSPDFKVKALKWLNDNLLIFRDKSGDSYKKLASYLQKREDIISIASIGVILPKIARFIKSTLKVNDWNEATELQLKQRDEIHKNFIMLLDAGVEINKALQVATKNAIEVNNAK